MARIFLCHASEDKAQVREVYHRLHAIEGFEPWLDEEDLLPGQDWDYEIKQALKTSDFILIFLSVDPMEPTGAGTLRVFRGGSWSRPAQPVRAANRGWSAPGFRNGDLGCRCASSGRRR